MAQFDVSFLNPKYRSSGGGSTYGIAVDALDILESRLSADGKLSPGDYDLLINKAQEIYPTLNESGRSNVQVKIERYKSAKSSSNIKEVNDIGQLNNDVKDEKIRSNMLLSKNPVAFVEGNIKITRAKLGRLSDAIDQMQNSGQDASQHLIEYQNTLNEYNDLVDVNGQMAAYKSGSNAPIPGYAAYITTNSKGEITDVRIDRSGNVTGYAQTNGLYGGLPIYGKATKQGDKLVFKIGDQSFSAADIALPDPMNPGSFKANTLTADSQKSSAGRMTRSTAGQYLDIDPNGLRSQTSVPAGGYAMGSNGFLYQAKGDGTYKKIVNATPEQLGITENDFINIPKDYESRIITPRVTETMDYSAPITPMVPPSFETPTTGPTSVQNTGATSTTTPAAKGTSRTPSPTDQSPQDASGYAAQSQSKGKGFLSRLFGAFKGGF